MACTLPRCTPDAARRACSSSRSCPGAKLFGPARSRHRQRRGAAKVKFKALQGQQEMLQRDLRRKARALAEAAPLQVLKKISSAVGGRGRMTCPEQRQTRLRRIQDVCTAGARLGRAWGQIGLSARTVQRWQRPEWPDGDRRVAGLHERAALAKNPSRAERDAALQIVDGDAFRNLPPSQIVPRLTDQGRDGTSVSALYRLLQLAGKIAHRRLERVPQKRSNPRALTATQPDQIYCWDTRFTCPRKSAARTSACTCLQICSAARPWAGRCSIASALNWSVKSTRCVGQKRPAIGAMLTKFTSIPTHQPPRMPGSKK
jgi:hypothetical protein